MNVILEDERKKNVKLKIFYIGIIVICVIAFIATVTFQILGDKEGVNTEKIPELSENQKNKHKDEFYKIFKNKVNYLENNSYKIAKLEQDKEIIYTGYQNTDNKINSYDLKVNIPYININNPIIEEFNNQIKDIFEKKAKSIINSQNKNAIYTVDYSAYISNNILSLVVRSTLKEGTNPQRDIIQTYNYDLTNQTKYTIDNMLEAKGISKKEANQKIKEVIKGEQEKQQELEKLGYSTFTRDYTSDMYNINNVTEYFMGEEGALYIIYAYGNENNTNEMDIVII